MQQKNGREATIVVGGATYKLSKLSLPLLQEFIEWSKKHTPDPFEKLAERIKGLPPELQRHAYDHACQQAELRGSLQDQGALALLTTVGGITHALSLCLRKYQPHLSEADARRVVEDYHLEHGGEALADLMESLSGSVESDPAAIADEYLEAKGKLPPTQKKSPSESHGVTSLAV